MGAHQDRWMERWLPLLRTAAAAGPVLELGCDAGDDTRWLLQLDAPVVATDISFEALRRASVAIPGAAFVCHDLRHPLPFAASTFCVIVASLCLHYFDRATTEAAIAEVRRCLAPGGLLLCRVNSERDLLHGAGEGEEIEPGFFRQSAYYADTKRFFSAADLDHFFPSAHWECVSREEREVLRYHAPKVAWELVLRSPR